MLPWVLLALLSSVPSSEPPVETCEQKSCAARDKHCIEQAMGPCRRGCEKGAPQACYRLGVLLTYTPPGTLIADPGHEEEARKIAAGVSGPVWVLTRAEATAQRTEAKPAFEKACAAGVGEACVGLSFLVRQGPDESAGRFDDAGSVRVLESACARKLRAPCLQLAEQLVNGDGVAADGARAKMLYDDACAAKDEDACLKLGLLLVRGASGLAPETARGLALLDSMCSGKKPAACAALSDLYANGLGVPLDDGKRRAWAKKACALGKKGYCF